MKEQLFFSTFLIFLSACLISAQFKWRFRQENMSEEDFKKVFPCRTKFIRLYMLQLTGIPYLWHVGEKDSLILINAILLIGFAAVLGYSSDIYYFGERKSFKQSFWYYLPGAAVLLPIVIQAFSGIHFIPEWIAIAMSIAVSFRYIFKQVKISRKIGRMITNIQKGMYSDVDDFPFKQARAVQWTPLVFTFSAMVILIVNNPWVNVVRDLALAYLSVMFIIYSLNTRRKYETNLVMTKGESIGNASVRKTMSEKKYNELRNALEKVMEEEKIYLDQHVDMVALQKAVGTNRNYIYEVIGRSGHGSFYEMINRRRVEHAKGMMQSDPDMMLADIAEASGFCSPSAFSKAFKTYTGMTPSKYVAQIREK